MGKGISRFVFAAVASILLFIILALFAILPSLVQKKSLPTTGAFLGAAATASVFFVMIAGVIVLLFLKYIGSSRRAPDVKQD